jgi:hypothetical protein
LLKQVIGLAINLKRQRKSALRCRTGRGIQLFIAAQRLNSLQPRVHRPRATGAGFLHLGGLGGYAIAAAHHDRRVGELRVRHLKQRRRGDESATVHPARGQAPRLQAAVRHRIHVPRHQRRAGLAIHVRWLVGREPQATRAARWAAATHERASPAQRQPSLRSVADCREPHAMREARRAADNDERASIITLAMGF